MKKKIGKKGVKPTTKEEESSSAQTAFKKFDNGKLEYHLLPEEALEEVVRVLMVGAKKYGEHSWKDSEEVQWTRYINAMERHLKRFKQGMDTDPETDLLEMAHVVTNGLFLLYYQIRNEGIDNRDPYAGKVYNNVRLNYKINVVNGNSLYNATCLLCYGEFEPLLNNVKKNNTKSCGCEREAYKTHGMSNSKIYLRWAGMINRCNNKNHISYKSYGAKGISVCERWLDFNNFYEDMGDPPNEKSELDRIDSEGNYEPDNVRWLDSSENRKRKAALYDIHGQSKSLNDWCKQYNINSRCVRKRLLMGWDLIRALTTPSRKDRHKNDDTQAP